ncbi:major facilitator superfamily domain-containing protein [Aspergillus keveii]|uniref:Major facilitator superfamily domain-containing protein n=1 Tax=Aspergillus keveii TaxID=714993 RepID=A0ABR4FXM9_9EURO
MLSPHCMIATRIIHLAEICPFAGFYGIGFGYDSGWSGRVLDMPLFIRPYTGNPCPQTIFGTGTISDAYVDYAKHRFVVKTSQQSLFTSILPAVTFLGAIAAGDIADHLGRRPTIILGCGSFTFIAGLGVGFISATIIMYMSEIAPKKVRGAMVSGYQFYICVGVLLANCAVYATKDRDHTGSYSIPIGIQFLWSTVLADKTQQAAKALSRIRFQPNESVFVQNELADKGQLCLREARDRRPDIVHSKLDLLLQGKITDGSSNLRRRLLAVFISSLGTIPIPFFITLIIALRIGRRRILAGPLGMILYHNNAAVTAMIAFICLSIATFATTWGPAVWVVFAIGLSTASTWFWNCIIAAITPYLVFFIWGGLCCVSLAFSYFLVSETKGLSLEQVDKMSEEVSPRLSGKWVPHSTFAGEMGLVDAKEDVRAEHANEVKL